jgi:ABC-type nitrate/sulfonate/bicarbonate transport system permease component
VTLRKALPSAITLVLLIAGWQAYTSLSGIDKWLLPSPKGIGDAALLQREALTAHTLATTELTLYGFGAGVATGLLVAVLLHLIPVVRSAVYPLLVISQNVSVIAITSVILLALIVFGLVVLLEKLTVKGRRRE